MFEQPAANTMILLGSWLLESFPFPLKKDEAWRWVDLNKLNFAALQQSNRARRQLHLPEQLEGLTKEKMVIQAA